MRKANWTLRRLTAASLPLAVCPSLLGAFPAATFRSRAETSDGRRSSHARAEPDREARKGANTSDISAQRDFFVSVLSASATKREAKAYLSRFRERDNSETRAPRGTRDAVCGAVEQPKEAGQGFSKTGVNLGRLYAPARAIEHRPVFLQQFKHPEVEQETESILHVAVVLIRSPQSLEDDVLGGIGLTLGQLYRLGLHSVVVFDCGELDDPVPQGKVAQFMRHTINVQSDRLATAFRRHNPAGARYVSDALGVTVRKSSVSTRVEVHGRVRVQYNELLLRPLQRGVSLVISTMAHDIETQQMRLVSPDDVIMALTREFSGIASKADNEELDVQHVVGSLQEPKPVPAPFSLDRIIILDPTGGIPSADSADRSHVFINLEQEYDRIKSELQHLGKENSTASNEKEVGEGSYPKESDALRVPDNQTPTNREVHGGEGVRSVGAKSAAKALRNLDLVQRALAILPPSSSALITTATEAARSAAPSAAEAERPGVRTRLHKNALIHNLLTDKPVVSSSLPSGRLPYSSHGDSTSATRPVPATFVKRGMPLTIIPDPTKHAWIPPAAERPTTSLTKPPVDLPRLIHLIEDSFNRPLDVEHYLGRIRDRTAGIIIAGEYEGGAILTWETPSPTTSPSSSALSSRPPVPYLDKFAVLKRSQGAGGVADVVFTAMVRTCFPNGVVWRSRANNPVNKWYFERAVGSWKMPGTQWAMFWTTEGVERNPTQWKDYVQVCRGVQPSWADMKDVAD